MGSTRVGSYWSVTAKLPDLALSSAENFRAQKTELPKRRMRPITSRLHPTPGMPPPSAKATHAIKTCLPSAQ
jgi:hypothetical protein